MIARQWRCRCPRGRRDEFLLHLDRTGVAEARRTPGYLGHVVCQREPGACGPDGAASAMVEISLVTYWASWDAVTAFAGGDPGRAVLYPDDAAYGIEPDLAVRHDLVVEAAFPGLLPDHVPDPEPEDAHGDELQARRITQAT